MKGDKDDFLQIETVDDLLSFLSLLVKITEIHSKKGQSKNFAFTYMTRITTVS